MENREEMALNGMDDMIYSAITMLEASDDAAKKADGELSQMGDEITSDPALDEETRERLRLLINRTIEVTAEQFRYLYIQGAKDCVEALRKLGVIK